MQGYFGTFMVLVIVCWSFFPQNYGKLIAQTVKGYQLEMKEK